MKNVKKQHNRLKNGYIEKKHNFILTHTLYVTSLPHRKEKIHDLFEVADTIMILKNYV